MATYTQPQSVACRLICFQLICTDERPCRRSGKGKQAWPVTDPPVILFAAISRSSVLHQSDPVNCNYEVVGGGDSKEVPVGGSNWRRVDPPRHQLHQPALQEPKRQHHSIQFNSIQFNSIQFNSIQFDSIQYNSAVWTSLGCVLTFLQLWAGGVKDCIAASEGFRGLEGVSS